jgi:LMBR1 domain-containing protein 1
MICQCAAFREVFTVRVSVAIYLIALTTLLGWILFSIFGGVGLVALPLDLLMDWKNGPRPIKTDE